MFRKSRFCKADKDLCVEVDIDKRGIVMVRDSASPDLTLYFTNDEWQKFIDGVKAGDFDLR